MNDTVVAWAALPICTTEFKILEGRFKIPFLRGDVDHSMIKYHVNNSNHVIDLHATMISRRTLRPCIARISQRGCATCT
jgi:hypothetical protein